MTEIDDQTLERIIAWTDGELDDEARADFEAELERDEALREAVASYRATLDALPTLNVEAPVDFEQRVQRRIRRRSRGRFFNPEAQQQRMQAAVFAAIAALLLGGIALFSSSGPIRLLWTDEGSGEVAPGEGSGEDATGEDPTAPSDAPPADEDADTTTGDGVTPARLTDPPRPDPGTPEAGSGAATSGLETVDPMRVSWAYTVQTDMDIDALRTRLGDEFGRAVRIADGGFEVVVPAREHAETLRALGRLGEVSRERVERPAVLSERVFVVRPAP